MKIERLSGDYNRGYTKAIMDIQEIFKYIKPDLKHHHKNMSFKMADDLLNAILENRINIRDDMKGFIRWNGNKNVFEYFNVYVQKR